MNLVLFSLCVLTLLMQKVLMFHAELLIEMNSQYEE